MNLLFIGDIVGRPGRDLVRRGVPILARVYDIDLVIANVENAAGGTGITRETAEAILSAGVHVMTTGNHVWDKKEAVAYIASEPRLLRPLNYPAAAPGRGVFVTRTASGHAVAVINVMGRVHMPLVDDPFAAVGRALDDIGAGARTIFVDVHAEATSEKVALGWHLDGRVTAVVGTHTHVQTADERVLPGGTAYITDAGMTGPHDSVIGVERAAALARFLTGLPARFETATGNPRLNGVVIGADPGSGRATTISRVSVSLQDLDVLAAGAAPA
jgi:metallophosphoesterase (TIGR00282 family)